MDTGDARWLNRSSPSCLNSGTQRTDFFHGLLGVQNVFDTYSQVSVIANAVGEQYSEYMPWGYSGAYYYVRIGYDWGN